MNRNNIQKQSNLALNENHQFTASIETNNQLNFNLEKSSQSENTNLYNNDHNIMDLTHICHLIGIFILKILCVKKIKK
jgi:hypothetical protein